jgi:hypothetical protein
MRRLLPSGWSCSSSVFRASLRGASMSQISRYSQFIIVADFGAICFGFGYLIGLIVARNEWGDRYIGGLANGNGMSRKEEQ